MKWKFKPDWFLFCLFFSWHQYSSILYIYNPHRSGSSHVHTAGEKKTTTRRDVHAQRSRNRQSGRCVTTPQLGPYSQQVTEKRGKWRMGVTARGVNTGGGLENKRAPAVPHTNLFRWLSCSQKNRFSFSSSITAKPYLIHFKYWCLLHLKRERTAKLLSGLGSCLWTSISSVRRSLFFPPIIMFTSRVRVFHLNKKQHRWFVAVSWKRNILNLHRCWNICLRWIFNIFQSAVRTSCWLNPFFAQRASEITHGIHHSAPSAYI